MTFRHDNAVLSTLKERAIAHLAILTPPARAPFRELLMSTELGFRARAHATSAPATPFLEHLTRPSSTQPGRSPRSEPGQCSGFRVGYYNRGDFRASGGAFPSEQGTWAAEEPSVPACNPPRQRFTQPRARPSAVRRIPSWKPPRRPVSGPGEGDVHERLFTLMLQSGMASGCHTERTHPDRGWWRARSWRGSRCLALGDSCWDWCVDRMHTWVALLYW